ncbi:hypothetical protein ACIODW_20560 [Streptomyces sp. NPDC087897]|uniref:hypothetical protein n=1 Tax=Streptomyces sp. NPDC087897 TaxID=3365817 RepID=UPI00382D863D
MNDVRELLEYAVADAGQPALRAEAVYARAARVRRRRRAAVSAAAVCALAVGAFAVSGLSAEPPPRTSSVAAPSMSDGTGERARKLIGLLPEGIGSVQQVPLAAVLGQGQAGERPRGPLDGQYAVRRDGGVGFLIVSLLDAEAVTEKSGGVPEEADPCKPGAGERNRTDCVHEELPDGRALTIRSDSMDEGNGTPRWGPELSAWLTLKDGRELIVRNSTGFEADSALGPLLKDPPLTRAQLRTLILSPELLPQQG